MSFDNQQDDGTPGSNLSNLDFADRYRQLLGEHLPGKLVELGDFFAGLQRLHTCARLLHKHIDGQGLSVLNVGCGPFATELFVKGLQKQSIMAIDYTPEFAPLLPVFQEEGLLHNTTFRESDAMALDFEPNSFDLIIVHDVLYETALDMEPLLQSLNVFLKPEGLLFFDFINAGTAWIWRLLGREKPFRRYNVEDVKTFLVGQNFETLAFVPTHGARSRLVRAFHDGLWAIFKASNNYAVLARKRQPS